MFIRLRVRDSLRSLVAALALASLFGCGQESPDKLLASAKSYIARNDNAAAIIQLKNALQRQPDLAEARFLLGKTLLASGDPVGAEVELGRAADLKYPADDVVPLRAKALLESGAPRKVIELDGKVGLSASESVADFKTTVARAYLLLDDRKKADLALRTALQAKYDYPPAMVFRARLLAIAGDFEASMKIVDQVIAKGVNADALVLKGDILRYANKDSAGAIATYKQALADEPNHPLAHAALMETLLSANDLQAARTELNAMKKVPTTSRAFQTLYFEARLEAQEGHLQRADELSQQLLKIAPEELHALQLAGVLALRQDRLLVAQTLLAKVVQRLPDSVTARQLLARAYLRGGDAARTLAILQPLLEADAPDGKTLTLAGAAALLAGDAGQAQHFFDRASKLDPSSTLVRTGVAMTRMASGDAAEALQELEAIAASDTRTDADLSLITALIGRREFDAALKAIDRLTQKSPGNPLVFYLRGQVLSAKADWAGARSAFEKALAADPMYLPAIDRLAALDMRDNKPEAARARFEGVLKVNPRDVRAMVGLAHVLERTGKPKEEVAALYAKAISTNPTEPWLRRQLVDYYFSKQEPRLALGAAQEAASALPNNPDVLLLLATSQLAAGEISQASASYRKLSAQLPQSLVPLLGLADAQTLNKSYGAAGETLKKAAELAPDSMAVIQRRVKIDLLSGMPDAALAKARAVQTKFPQAAQGFVLEGNVESYRKEWARAISAFKAALKRDPTAPEVAKSLYFSLRNTGDVSGAESFASDWIKRQPSDLGFRFYLVTQYIADQSHARAEKELREILNLAPENLAALNNLAWVLNAQKKPEALEAAEQLNRLAANQPAFMDTLATVLADRGELARAVDVQRRAVELAPQAGILRLKLARLQIQSGNTAAARAELEKLAALGSKFPQQDEVRQLMGKL